VDRAHPVLVDLPGRLAALPPELLWPAAGALAALALAAALAAVLALAAARRGRGARDAFAAVAAEALQRNGESFLLLAGERLRGLQEVAASDLAGRHKAIEDLVGPLGQTLAELRAQTQALEKERHDQTGALGEQLRALAAETSRLSHALRAPGARGRWGELTLRRTVELAGLSEHCDFAEQVSLGGPDGTARPDMVVRLPAGREIAVDAKAPLEGYLEAAEAPSDEARGAALERHARSVRRHVDALGGRDYASRLARAPEFVVLFLPDDGFLASAVARDRGLVEHALRRGVVVATPATLYALLVAVAQGWREGRLADETRRILDVARELDDRLGTFAGHLAQVGASLGRCVGHYNAALGSFESRLLPQARRLRELGVDGRKEIDAPAPVDAAPRAPAASA
jgi:DNA recombination protein RmuC